jgi:DNA-binding response OmpR family regulator
MFSGPLISTATPDIPQLPRPAIVVGGIPCERFASACLSQNDVAYVAVVEADNHPEFIEDWVDAVITAPRDSQDIRDAGEMALRRKQRCSSARPVVGTTTFAWRGATVELPPLEARLVRRLVNARGAVVSKQDLAYDLWGAIDCDPGRAVDAHIYRIRKRLATIPGVEIATERQRGFRLLLDPSVHIPWPSV